MKKIVSGIMLTLTLVSMLTLAFSIQLARAEPKTIYVDDDNIAGPWDGTQEHPFQNMISGLEHASTSDTIFVYNGTYYEHLVVDKTVSLVGENRSTTIVDGSGTGTVIILCTNNVRMDGFTVQNGYYGIYLNSSKGTITRNTIKNNFFGIYLSHSNDNNLSEDIIENNYYGIYSWGSSNNTISKNILYDNGHGIDLWEDSSNIIIKNVAKNNGAYGIYAYHSHMNIISENTFNNSWYGISLDRSNGNKVISNVVANNADGIFVYDSRNNIVRRNMIVDNRIWLNGRGVLIGGYLTSEHYYNNTICGNTIRNNRFGIQLYQYADHNWICHNNFIDNQIQADIDEFTSNNIWDNGYPSGGNYWSDYNGMDLYLGPYQNETGSDGIGDTAYVVDAYNVDHYPFMNPYVAPTYALIITTTSGGTTNPAPRTYSYEVNSSIQVTAIPNANYLFDHWELDSINVGSANPYTVLMDKDHTFKAVFSPIPPPPKPVGGYSFLIEGYTTAKPLTPYLALIAILAMGFTTIRRKAMRKTK